MNQFAIYVKLTQYCKSTILQHKLIFKNKQKKKKKSKEGQVGLVSHLQSILISWVLALTQSLI